jgi:8-oxo-dGTP pyrophosphatase MutT (NUDIX family)
MLRALDEHGEAHVWTQVRSELDLAPERSVGPTVPQEDRQQEVHVAAVCIDPDGHVLVARRNPDKHVLGGKWEFGCARVRTDEDFEEAIRREYKDDFDLVVTRFSPSKSALAYYDVAKSDGKMPGVIVPAWVGDATGGRPAVRLHPSKHVEHRWVDPAAPPPDVLADGVPNIAGVLEEVAARFPTQRALSRE